MKILVVSFLTFLCIKCQSQDTTGVIVYSIDTIAFKKFTSKKVVIFKYHEISFLLNYTSVDSELVRLSKEYYWGFIAKELISKISSETEKGDTAYLDQQTFDKIDWVPFDDFLCNELEKRSCLIIDSMNNIHRSVIRVHSVRKAANIFVWGGWFYFLPELKGSFKECTEWES